MRQVKKNLLPLTRKFLAKVILDLNICPFKLFSCTQYKQAQLAQILCLVFFFFFFFFFVMLYYLQKFGGGGGGGEGENQTKKKKKKEKKWGKNIGGGKRGKP